MSWRDIRPVAVALVTRPLEPGVRDGDDGQDEPTPHDGRPDPGGRPARDGTDDVEVLLGEHRDPAAGETFYRPPGGGLEFGEHSSDALVREFDEEMSVTLRDLDLLATLERTFTFDGTEGHEIWFLYGATIAEDWPYDRDRFVAEEPEVDEQYEAVWKPLSDFAGSDADIVYPEELPELL